MQKREQGKSAGAAGGATAPTPKRGRPFGSGNSNAAAASAAAETAAPSNLLGPSLHVHSSFAGQFFKTLALCSISLLHSKFSQSSSCYEP